MVEWTVYTEIPLCNVFLTDATNVQFPKIRSIVPRKNEPRTAMEREKKGPARLVLHRCVLFRPVRQPLRLLSGSRVARALVLDLLDLLLLHAGVRLVRDLLPLGVRLVGRVDGGQQLQQRLGHGRLQQLRRQLEAVSINSRTVQIT